MIRRAISGVLLLLACASAAMWGISHLRLQYARKDFSGQQGATVVLNQGTLWFMWKSTARNNTDYGILSLFPNESSTPGHFRRSLHVIVLEVIILGSNYSLPPFLRQSWVRFDLPSLWLLASAIGLPFWLRSPVRRWRRHRRGLCLKCAYDLTGNTTGVCPECGTRI